MSSTSKALELLSYFSASRPEIGLSQLCKIVKRDKATTYRHMQSLEKAGFIEKNPISRHYRLGPALVQLAEIREVTVPRKETAKAILKVLADVTGETAHVSVLSGNALYGLCECEATHNAIRAVIDLNIFPLHATASGLCALAYGPSELMKVACENLVAFTEITPRTQAELSTLVQSTRQTGFGHAERSYENEIQGLATPVFDHGGQFAGSVAVACVASRFNASTELSIKSELMIAAREITRLWGGRIPSHIENPWAKLISTRNILEGVK